jgi:mono/diheme cytochrome c family protein
MARTRRCLIPLVLILVPAVAARDDDGQGPDAVALFARNCATCHGLDGSGTGPSVLDRPARNFKEGGFSFGNTAEAIARTLAHGIPGSPMPSFEGVLSEVERRALAEYVVTLGPPVKEVSEAETIMVVKDRPLIVRGILPPLVEGGPKIPRGLLVGLPDGLTFEYDVDGVRLLAVRQGDFVKRTDWGGRGGTPLEPLGRLIWSDAPGGNPPQRWCLAHGEWVSTTTAEGKSRSTVVEHLLPLRVTLKSTGVLDGVPSLDYELRDAEAPEATPLATVHESVRFLSVGPASGFARAFELEPTAPARTLLAVVAQDPVRGATLAGMSARTGADGQIDAPDDGLVWWFRTDHGDGSVELTGLTKLVGNGECSWSGSQEDPPTGPAIFFVAYAGDRIRLRNEVITLMAAAWTPDLEAALGLLSDR